MAKRKYDFSHLTQEQLADIEASYPQAVDVIESAVIRKPVYKNLAMLLELGMNVPHLTIAQVAAENARAAASPEIE